MSDESQNKMYNYEVTPPAKVWDKITAALDESELTLKFPSTLYRIEIIPPDTAWDKIRTSLDSAGETTIPEHKRISPFLRYAAAAAIISLIVLGAVKLFTGNKNDQEVAKIIPPSKDTSSPITTEYSNITGNNSITTDELKDAAALEDSKRMIAKLDVPARNKMRIMADKYFSEPIDLTNRNTELNPGETYRELPYSEESLKEAIAGQEIYINPFSRYIILMTPDGNFIRISKKLSDLVCCVSGQEQDEDCKDQLKKWREKIAGSSIAPSPGNFMDILSLINSLQD